MNKLLVIVDMQNDFITGSLANPLAENKIPAMVEYIKNFQGAIGCTIDTHFNDYIDTEEGKHIPPHCQYLTYGWELQGNIAKALQDRNKPWYHVCKNYFGADAWADNWDYIMQETDEIILIGTCTDLCVLANAIVLKSLFPYVKVTVLSDLCAPSSIEKQELALQTMRNLLINVQRSDQK